MVWLGILLLVPMILATEEGAMINVNKFTYDFLNHTKKSIKVICNSSKELNLADLCIKNLPENTFKNVTHIRVLDLHNNSLSKLSETTFASLKNVEHLNLSYNKIDGMRNPFAHLENLKQLDLSNNRIQNLSRGDFFGLTESCVILLKGNNISLMSTELFENKSYPIISINKPHQNETKPDVSPFFKQSIKICINDSKLISVEHFTAGEKLAIGCNSDRYYENEFLHLNSSSIKRFEKGWYKIRNSTINHIDLSGNCITRVTSEMLNYLPKEISSVNLSQNCIQRLEKNVIINEHLRKLNFEFNKIDKIEDDAFINTNVTELHLGENKLNDTKFAVTLPRTLEKIDLYRNEIAEISPDSFSKLNKLRYLMLMYNNITVIHSDSFRGLEKLSSLRIYKNKIHTIEAGSFKYLPELRYLHLQYNNISKLGSCVFANLKNIALINIGHNTLSEIQRDTFENSVNLCQLFLSGNPIKKLGNGALHSLRKHTTCGVYLWGVPIEIIHGGVFTIPLWSSGVQRTPCKLYS